MDNHMYKMNLMFFSTVMMSALMLSLLTLSLKQISFPKNSFPKSSNYVFATSTRNSMLSSVLVFSSSSPEKKPATNAGVTSTKKNVTKTKIPGRIVNDGYGNAYWDEDSGTLSFEPKISQRPNEKHSSLFVSNVTLKQPYEVNFTLKTLKQLRSGSAAHPWEVGWFLFGYKREDIFKYLILKPNGYGIEIGEVLPGDEQIYLYTSDRYQYNFPIKNSYDVSVKVKENTLSLTVNGKKYPDYVMSSNDTLTLDGPFGFYTEDAAVEYTNVKFRQLK